MDKPFELQFYECLNERCELPTSVKNRLARQQVGYEGHLDFINILRDNLPGHFVLLNDIFYKLPYKFTQIDSVLITVHAIYRFEVKNLLSEFTYKEGFWYRKGERLSRNFFTQVKRAGEIFEEIIQNDGLYFPVESQLVFINEDDTVKIFDQENVSPYLMRWELRSYLKKVVEDSRGGSMNPKEVAKYLMSKATEGHLVSEVMDKKLRALARSGILCENCDSWRVDVISRRYHILCKNCGRQEPKQRAVLRTICDYGVLYYEWPLTKSSVTEFIGEPSLEYIIKRTLRNYFELHSKGKASTYVNPAKRMKFAFKDEEFRYYSK